MFCSLGFSVGKTKLFCGPNADAGASADTSETGNRQTASFYGAAAACPDPLNPSGWYLAESFAIKYFDESKDEVSAFAGAHFGRGQSDGIGPAAGFSFIFQLLIASDGKTIWCGQAGPTRRIDTASREVTSQYLDPVLSLCWDRSPRVKPDSALYLVVAGGGLRRFDTVIPELVTLTLPRANINSKLYAKYVDCTATGHLLISTSSPVDGAVYAFDPITSDLQQLDILPIDSHAPFVLIERDRLLVATNGRTIISCTLPPHYFSLPKCCDRDL